MNILVTGGAGYIGNILINKIYSGKSQFISNKREREILEKIYKSYGFESKQKEKTYDELSHVVDQKFSVTVYDNLLYRQNCLTEYCYKEDFDFVFGDVRDTNKLKKCIDEADVIIPLAAIVGFPACEKDPQLAKDVNYEQIKFILNNTSKDQKIIFPNTNSGYGVGEEGKYCTEETPLNPISIYGKTKCDSEKLLLDSGRAITLRLATVFGISPRMRLDLLVNDFVYRAVNDCFIVLFEKDFMRNYIHIQDVALTFLYMMNNFEKHVGNTFNVGLSSANISKIELCEKIKQYIPKFIIKHDDFNMDPDKRNYIVSNEKLENTGWKPYYSLDYGIKELIKAYQIISHNNKKFTNL